jgi:hypothetical protein
MQKVGLWGNPQFYSMREQSDLVSLTWVYCICHLAQGQVGGRLAVFFPALTSKCHAVAA